MSFNRRNFLHKAGALTATAFFSSLAKPACSRNLERPLRNAEVGSAQEVADEEDCWYYVQRSLAAPTGLINLNNGGVSPTPKAVADAMKRYDDMSHEAPSYFMWHILDRGREPLRREM